MKMAALIEEEGSACLLPAKQAGVSTVATVLILAMLFAYAIHKRSAVLMSIGITIVLVLGLLVASPGKSIKEVFAGALKSNHGAMFQ